jgi:hypothetical protein
MQPCHRYTPYIQEKSAVPVPRFRRVTGEPFHMVKYPLCSSRQAAVLRRIDGRDTSSESTLTCGAAYGTTVVAGPYCEVRHQSGFASRRLGKCGLTRSVTATRPCHHGTVGARVCESTVAINHQPDQPCQSTQRWEVAVGGAACR